MRCGVHPQHLATMSPEELEAEALFWAKTAARLFEQAKRWAERAQDYFEAAAERRS